MITKAPYYNVNDHKKITVIYKCVCRHIVIHVLLWNKKWKIVISLGTF